MQRRKVVLLLVVLFAAAMGAWLLRDVLSLQYLADREERLRRWYDAYPLLAASTAFAAYVVVTSLSLPAATAMTVFCGWYFGFWNGLVISSFGSTAGATVAFLLSRYLLRDWVQSNLQQRFSRINEAFEQEGAFYLFTLRLLPIVPFFVINLVMGLTKISTITFWWVSQLGMLPAAVAYTYAGSVLPSLQVLADEGIGRIFHWQLLVAFAIIGLLPLAVKRIVSAVRGKTQLPDTEL